MTQENLITPPFKLVHQWDKEGTKMFRPEYQLHLTRRAARWGADQELKACVEWLREALVTPLLVNCLIANRRPNQLSLKEQALEAVESGLMTDARLDTIRRALEQLPDDTSLAI